MIIQLGHARDSDFQDELNNSTRSSSTEVGLYRNRIFGTMEMQIPDSLSKIPYNTNVNPDKPPVDFSHLSNGANCLIFAYAILKYNGFSPPILWPRELWDDGEFTQKVEQYIPGDILLFGNNESDTTWWHAAVSLGGDGLIHLSKAVGFPEVTTYQELLKRGSYKCLFGAKRLK